jgi:hypothetical protein
LAEEAIEDQSVAVFEEDYSTEGRSSILEFDMPMFKPVFDF